MLFLYLINDLFRERLENIVILIKNFVIRFLIVIYLVIYDFFLIYVFYLCDLNDNFDFRILNLQKKIQKLYFENVFNNYFVFQYFFNNNEDQVIYFNFEIIFFNIYDFCINKCIILFCVIMYSLLFSCK